ncbi:MAG: peptidoglycan DD-metalloendopeptidase family protein, partial [Acidimicrobiales bacterium]
MRRLVAPALLSLVALLGRPGTAPAAVPAAAPNYQAPVDASIADPFRPPAHRYGPGNLGVDYATRPGQPVRAAAPGVVTFAGAVGAARHVVVGHADGIRTTYAFLGRVLVRAGT